MLILYILLGLVGALVLVLGAVTALRCARARKLTGDHPQATPEALEPYAQALGDMLRCRTVSRKDSYDDTEFAKLREVMARHFPLVHARAQRQQFSQDCWVYKVPGLDESRNILLMSHHDVVEADEAWTQEPFGGQVVEGKIYGRGAADTKGSLCAIFFAMETLLAQGITPPVNVYLASSHNEEQGGDGIPSALRWFQEQGIRFEVILDEGGAIVDPPLGNMHCEKCAMIAVHEKGRCKVLCTVRAGSSHVSLTGYKDNPVERMAAFVQEVTRRAPWERRLNPQVRGMFASLAPYCSLPLKVLFSNLWLFGGLLLRVLPKINGTAGGMVGTTCNFQTLQGGTTQKVCTAEAMLRNIDPESLEQDLARFRAMAEKYGITVEITRQEYYAPADLQSPAWAYTLAQLEKIFPRYPAAPYILPAGTDAWRLTPVCSCVLRFAPTRMSAQQLGSVHAADENLDVSAIYEAAVFYRSFVENYGSVLKEETK